MELKQYFKIIQKKLWLIAAIVIIACIGTAIKSYYFTTSIYQANAKLIVNQPEHNADGLTITSRNSVETNIMLINSYKEIIKSAAIMNKVAEQYPDLKLSPREWSEKISVTAADKSQVMSLTYTGTSYDKAAKSVNAISHVFKEQIPFIMKVDNVTILNEAIVEDFASPVNMNPVLNIIIGFIASLMLALGIVFLLDYLDNTFKSEVELEEALGIPTLAIITKFNKEDLRPRKQTPNSKKQKVGEGTYATVN